MGEDNVMKLIEIDISGLPKVQEMTEARGYITDNGLSIICSIDFTDEWGPLKHISISHPKRLPFWHDVVEIKDRLMGDIDAMMVMPKSEDYVNLHNYCFNIWQCPQDWGIR